jgi:tripeptide aminopeptidase
VPTPDLFTGGQNFHTRREWNSRKAMEQTVGMLVELVQLFSTDPPSAQ